MDGHSKDFGIGFIGFHGSFVSIVGALFCSISSGTGVSSITSVLPINAFITSLGSIWFVVVVLPIFGATTSSFVVIIGVWSTTIVVTPFVPTFVVDSCMFA